MEDPLEAIDPHGLRRPAPPVPVAARVRAWVAWVGPGRVVGTAVVVLAVLAAAYWLVKPPPATTESRLPFASTAPSTAPARSSTPTTGDGTSPTASGTAPAALVVHVAGAVARSGVYRVPAGSRVVDAVEVAGGLAADAQPDAINLAAPVTDGERVYVPHQGEEVSPPTVTTVAAGPVDLNTASADQLDELPGIGPATAAAIVAHREQFGPFGSVDDLADVKGIGPAKIEVLRGLVTV